MNCSIVFSHTEHTCDANGCRFEKIYQVVSESDKSILFEGTQEECRAYVTSYC